MTTDDLNQARFHGLALSGGGFRASFFHIGVLARLAELDLLRTIQTISTVSGGSIIGASYYLKVKERMEGGHVQRSDFIKIVNELCTEFLAGAKKDLRSRTFANFFANFRGTNSERIGKLYEEYFYRGLAGQSGQVSMPDLRIQPDDTAMEELRRKGLHEVPLLHINATLLGTGQRWTFTPQDMGALEDEPGVAKSSKGIATRLARRFDYSELDGMADFPLGLAVAASACVPVIFPPVRLQLWPFDKVAITKEATRLGQEPNKDEEHILNAAKKIHFELVDGGVVDNLGLGPLSADKRALISNASASSASSSLELEGSSTATAVGRSIAVLLDKTQYAADLQALARLGSNDNMTQISLGQLTQLQEVAESPEIHERMLDITEIRTDLDSFTDWEGNALMFAGYSCTKHALHERDVPSLDRKEEWPFDWVREYHEKRLIGRRLAGSSSHLKVIRLLPSGVQANKLGFGVIALFAFAYLVTLGSDQAGVVGFVSNVLQFLLGMLLIGYVLAKLTIPLWLAMASWVELLLRRPLLWLGRRPQSMQPSDRSRPRPDQPQ